MTISNSISVKPSRRSRRFARVVSSHHRYQSRYFVPSSAVPSLFVYTSNMFWRPHDLRAGIVLVRTHPPFVPGHRIDRNPAEELEFPPRRVVGHRHAIDERFEIRRIAFVGRLELG